MPQWQSAKIRNVEKGLTPPVVNNNGCKFANCAEVSLSKPVLLSRTAPVAVWYAAKPLLARRIRVVPERKVVGRFPNSKLMIHTSVDDASSFGQDSFACIGDSFIYTPEFASRRRSGEGTVDWRSQ